MLRTIGPTMADSPTDPQRPLVVVCSGNHLATPKQDAEAHLARRLTRHADVLFVDPPVSRLGAAFRPELASTRTGPRLRRVDPALTHLAPFAPPLPFSRPVAPVTAVTTRRAIRRALTRRGARPAVVVTTWPFCDVLDACPGARTVYWRTDDPVMAAALWGLDTGLLARGDARMIRRADLVLSVDRAFAETLRSQGVDARFFPNGCDTATIGRAVDLHLGATPTDRPVAAFVGLLNDRTDLALLEAVADRGVHLLVVGPVQPGFEPERVAALLQRDEVRATGPVPFAELPSLLAGVDVGLVPYRDSAFNRSSFPLKALEYLAAGRPVVATPLPAIRWLAEQADPDDIRLTDDPTTFADLVVDTLRTRPSATAVTRRAALAARHDWSERADLLAAWTGLLR